MKQSNSKNAVICRGGPENGLFSAQVFSTLSRGFRQAGKKIDGILAISGAAPTALLGCIGQEDKLCDIWRNIKPADIVGNINKLKISYNVVSRQESVFSDEFLKKLLEDNSDLNKIFSKEAMPIKILAVDYLTSEPVIITNRIPEHKKYLIQGILGAMGLVPWFPAQRIVDPENSKILKKSHPKKNEAWLIDGAYLDNILLEEAIRDPMGYSDIFLIDIHGVQISPVNLEESFSWVNKLKRVMHMTFCSRDKIIWRYVDRIDEEIYIKESLEKFADEKLYFWQKEDFEKIISRMNYGRLRLHDKHRTRIHLISYPTKSTLFNFAKFEKKDVINLMRAGHEAAIRKLVELGFELDNSIKAYPNYLKIS